MMNDIQNILPGIVK
jgi:hypothetical protein